MRVLRSQYLQLSKNANQSIQKHTIGKKVPCGSYITNGNEHDPYFNKFQNNENEVTILSQTSTRTTTTTTHVRRKSLFLSNNEARLFSTNAVNEKLDELYGFNGFPETTIADQTAPALIARRRQTMCCPQSYTQQRSHTMQIKFDNVPESVRKINITVEFVDMGSLWLTRIYQSYENDLWQKKPRHIAFRKTCRWYFYCLLCFRKYCSFYTLKGHLNLHLELYPYGCKLCTLQYTNRKAITRHLRSIHGIQREKWNEFIGD